MKRSTATRLVQVAASLPEACVSLDEVASDLANLHTHQDLPTEERHRLEEAARLIEQHRHGVRRAYELVNAILDRGREVWEHEAWDAEPEAA